MTKIFKDYSEFLSREDKTVNGVDQDFADDFDNWEAINETNKGCWNCSRCSDCSDCSDCSGCLYKEDLEGESAVKGEAPTDGRPIGFPNVPVVAGIHQKVCEAASQPQALNMSDWHTCSTTHCRAGWVVFLAGAEGKILEEKTSTQFAAMQIYHASSPEIHVSPVRFFESNNEAMQDMKQCAEREASLTI